MDINIINECTASSLANTMNFPEVTHKLISAGTERYLTDLAGLKKNYYGNQGETHFTSLDFPAGEVVATFDETAVRDALHAIQKCEEPFKTLLPAFGTHGNTPDFLKTSLPYLHEAFCLFEKLSPNNLQKSVKFDKIRYENRRLAFLECDRNSYTCLTDDQINEVTRYRKGLINYNPIYKFWLFKETNNQNQLLPKELEMSILNDSVGLPRT